MKEAFIHSEIYNDRVANWRTMSVNIFRHEICVCIMLTDICNEIILGNANPQRFTIDTAKYISVLAAMGASQTNLYRVVLRIQNSLTDYFECISVGYYMKEAAVSAPTYYAVTAKLDKIIDKIITNKSSYYGYNLEKIDSGCKMEKVYEYKGCIFPSYHDIVKTLPVKFGEYAAALKAVKDITNVYSIPKSGLDSAITNIFDSRVFKNKFINSNDICVEHTAKISLDAVKTLREYEMERAENKNILHILNVIMMNANSNGTYKQQYYRSSHGRLYQHGFSMQMLNSDYRDLILHDYQDVDIKAATFSILWNYARENGIHDDKMPTLYRYTKEPDVFRATILKKLRYYDNDVTMKYVKDVLNAIAFGARFNEARVLFDIKNHTKYSIPVSLEGYENTETPLHIVSLNEITSLVEEVKYITKKLAKKFTDKSGALVNAKQLVQEHKTRMPYGKKLSHLYQGAEVRVLETIMKYPINGKKLIDIPYAVGLLLHDGIYIKKDIVKTIDNILPLDLYIEKKLGYVLKFS